jgi:hypothetical protein
MAYNSRSRINPAERAHPSLKNNQSSGWLDPFETT